MICKFKLQQFSSDFNECFCIYSMRMDHIKITKSIFSPLSLIIVSALLVRLAIAVFFTPPLLQDEIEYVAIAQSLYHGNGFSVDGTPTAYRAPAYPTFVAAVFTAFGESVVPVRIIQAFADTLSCLFIFLIAKRFFSGTTPYIAASLYAIFPGNALYVSLLFSESIFTTLLLAIIFFYTKESLRNSFSWKIMIGTLLAILTLLRQNAPILLFAFIVWEVIRFYSWKTMWRRNILIVLSSFLFLFPWIIRNKIQFDHFSLTSNGGINFWIGHNQSANGSYKYLTHNNPLERVSGEFERSALGYKEGMDFLLHHPTEEVKLLFLKFAHFFEPDFSLMQSLQYKPEWKMYQRSILVYREFSPVIFFVLHFLTAMVVIAGLWSLIFAQDSKYQYLLLVRLIIVFWICSHLIFFGVARFRLPIMPFFIAMTAYSLEVWKAKSFSVTRSKMFLFIILTLLLFASWTAIVILLYFQ